jgi:hypothetical protein
MGQLSSLGMGPNQNLGDLDDLVILPLGIWIAILLDGEQYTRPAATEPGFEEAVFRVQVGDHLSLVTVDPATEHGE